MTLLTSNTVAGTQTPSPAAPAQHASGRCVQTGPSRVLGARKRHLHAGHHGCSPGGSDGAKVAVEGPCAVSNDSGSSSTLHGTFLRPPPAPQCLDRVFASCLFPRGTSGTFSA